MRGLANATKRRNIMKYLKDYKLDVVFLQETHVTKKNKGLWETEWGKKWFISQGTTASRGTVITSNPKSKVVLSNVSRDNDGRYIICSAKIENVVYTLCNLYAPNQDSPEFFEKIIKTLENYSSDHVIIGGDFNLTLNSTLDRYKSKHEHQNSQNLLTEYINENDMCDIWRIRNPDLKRYSWYKHRPNLSASRIDFFITNIGLNNYVSNIEYTTNIRTDHAMVHMEIKCNENKKGPGIWRFNNKLLYDEKYCEMIKHEITETVKECERESHTAKECWECIKINVTEQTQLYDKKKAGKKKILLNNLRTLHTKLTNEDLQVGRSTSEAAIQVKAKIVELENVTLQAAMFRARCTWHKFGEKSTKYF